MKRQAVDFFLEYAIIQNKEGVTMSKLRFGIMGAGRIARQFVRATRLVDCADVVAVASKSIERAQSFSKENGVAAFLTYDELLARDDIDAVYIATTHNFHYENIKACLENGKHVLCEKAMVLTEKDAAELCALAKEKGLFLMEAMWTRFLPSMQMAKKWITDGRIGKIQSISGVIGFKGDTDPESRLLNPALAGGALYDIGVYIIEIAAFLAGEGIVEAYGKTRRDSRTGVDSNVSFILEFESFDACLQCLITANPKEYMIINGDKGYIEIPRSHVSNECFLYDEKHKLTEHFREEFPDGNGFVYELEETVNCIRNGRTESDIMPHSATIECARVYDKLLTQ